jgi:hypothetical protein
MDYNKICIIILGTNGFCSIAQTLRNNLNGNYDNVYMVNTVSDAYKIISNVKI